MEEISTNLIPQSEPLIQDLEQKLKMITLEMQLHSKNGKYIQAQNCRLASQKLKKKIESSKVKQVIKKQKKQTQQIRTILKEEMNQFHQQWDQKLSLYEEQGKQLCSQLKTKHKKQYHQAKIKLQAEISTQSKDSSECLNLRKVQQGLAKQQNFLQAHKVQQLIKSMQSKQKEVWLKIRNQKIETKLEELAEKQEIQMQALKKRIQSGKWQLEVEKTKEEARLLLKHSNIKQQLKSENKRQCLTAKGELKTKIDLFSPTKSRLISPNTKSRLLSTR